MNYIKIKGVEVATSTLKTISQTKESKEVKDNDKSGLYENIWT